MVTFSEAFEMDDRGNVHHILGMKVPRLLTYKSSRKEVRRELEENENC